MAKKPDELDEFTLEHDDISDFASRSQDSKAARGGSSSAKSAPDAAAAKPGAPGLQGLLAKLPIAPLLDKAKDLVAELRASVSGAFSDQERPALPIILLGSGVAVLALLAIVMVVLLVGSLSGGPGQARQGLAGELQGGPPVAYAEGSVPGEGLSPEQSAPTVTSLAERSAVQELARDPLFKRAILPDEPLLMRQGEIRYQRQAQEFWSLSDIAPGWQELGKLYRTMLREQNRNDFYRLLGAPSPSPDPY